MDASDPMARSLTDYAHASGLADVTVYRAARGAGGTEYLMLRGNPNRPVSRFASTDADSIRSRITLITRQESPP